MASDIRERSFVTPAQSAGALPERISRESRWLLVASDALIAGVLALILANGAGSRIAAALLTAAIVTGAYWACNLYRRSYAFFAYDEAYYSIVAVAVAAIPALLLLVVVGNIDLPNVFAILMLTAAGTALMRVRLHSLRRSSALPKHADISTITMWAWHQRESAGYHTSKRIFDLALGSIAALVLLPVMLVCAIAIVLNTGYPVIFTQERIGENGRPFRIYKFRTMRVDAGDRWAKPHDDRITRVGAWLRRTSLDELPQIFNVLRGEMSLVGPRPEMKQFAAEFSDTIPNYDQRHVVAPGMTGWAQVYLKRNLQPSEMATVVPYDLFYVEYSSHTLDCAILLKTVIEFLSHRAV
jgi:lipopolysaccharide/colanic/teichoic acid biosynthesis glycosyltransferase